MNTKEIQKLVNKKLTAKDIIKFDKKILFNLNDADTLNYGLAHENRILKKIKNFDMTLDTPDYIYTSQFRYGRCKHFDMIDKKTKKGMWDDM